MHGGARERPDTLGDGRGADDDVDPPQQAPQGQSLGGAHPGERDVRQTGVRDRVLQVMGRLGGDGDHAHPRARRELGQLVKRLQMRLGQQRDHRDAAAPQEPLHLGEMTEARHRGPPVTGLLLPPHDRRQVAEQDLVDANRELALQLPGEEVELGRAALHEEDFDRLPDGRGPGRGHAEDPHRHVVGGHPERRRPDHHVLKQALA